MDPDYQPNNPINPELSEDSTSPVQRPAQNINQPNYTNNRPSSEPINQPAEPNLNQVNSNQLSGQELSSQEPASARAPQPQPTATVFSAEPVVAADPGSPSGSSKKKFIIIGAGVTALVVTIILLVVFLWYIPNTPARVWSSGLDRSGKAMDNILSKSTSKEALESAKKSELVMSGEVKSNSDSYSGDVTIKTDTKNTQGDAKISIKAGGKSAKEMAMDFRASVNPSDIFPSLYFKLSGIKSVFGSSAGRMLAFDNKWVSIEPSDFEQLGITPESLNQSKDKEVTPEDITELSKIVSDTISEYVLTSDTTKGVITQKEFLGKEKLGDVSTYKYSIEINKDNSRALCETLAQRVMKSSVYKKYASESSSKTYPEDIKKDCADATKDISNESPMVLWMDRKTKLIHKIRVTSKDDAGDWAEVSQDYNGGDNINLAIKYYSDKDKSNVVAKFDINIKTQTSTGSIEGQSKMPGNSASFKLTMKTKPLSDNVESGKPSGAVPFKTVMESYLGQ